MIGAKDLVTLGNAACGLAAILLCVQGRPTLAAAAIMVGYVFDVSDGLLARRMGGSNRFGAELDNLADHMTFGIAPAYCIYVAYEPISAPVGIALGGAYALAATIRHTRNLAYDVPTKLCWVGMPRPAAAFVAVAFIHSRLFQTQAGPWIGIAVVIGLLATVLGTWPFVNHRGRRLQWWARGFIVAWVAHWVSTAVFMPAYFWDVVLLWTFSYAALSWVVLSPEERRAFFDARREWKRGIVSGAKG